VNINYGDETGRFIMAPAQIPEIHKLFDPRVRPWYRGAADSGGLFWTTVYLFASTQKPGMTVSVPILGHDGKLAAVCGIDIDISALSRFLTGIHIGSQGIAYIFENKQKRVIAHPGLVQFPWNPYHVELLRTCLNNLKSKKKKFGMSRFQGDNFFTAYTDYPGKEWTVGVTLPFSDFSRNIKSIRKSIISLVGVGMLLSSIISYLLAMTIIRPLNELKNGIERISSGDLKYKVNLTGPDIASTLAGSFNTMAASLEASLTELKETYAELAQKEKLAAVGQMTATIAHEIKNPLGIILGSAQVVANDQRPMEMRQKAARFIMDEVASLNKTLTVFLNFAKPAAPNFRKTDMGGLLEEILAAVEERYNEQGYGVIKKIDSPLPPVLADPDQIRQVFLNLFLNGVQSMPDGGEILVEAGADGNGFLKVSFADKGCGMTPLQIEKIFDPFVSYRDNGVGLGLAIVSQTVKLHQGSLKVESEAGRGTRFEILFPLTEQEIGNDDECSSR